MTSLSLRAQSICTIPKKNKKMISPLEEKGQYVTIAFTTTSNYLVFATKFLLSMTIVTLC
jgi:hypothetical protein